MGYDYKRIRLDKETTRDEHRIIMEEILGRKLTKDEIVHHKNENKKDNRPENLEVMTRKEHTKMHFPNGVQMNEEQYERWRENNKEATKAKRIISPEGYSWCTSCKQHKPVEQFHKNKYTWHGYADQCKPCRQLKRNKYKKPDI